MSRFKIATRLCLLVGLALLVLAVNMALTLLSTAQDLRHERQALLQSVNEFALSLLEDRYRSVQAGAASEEEAKRQALKDLQAARFGKDGYLWVNDLDHVVLMHPMKPELNGRDQTQTVDPNGVALFVEFVKVAKASGQGFVEYVWPKPAVDLPVAKLSHVVLFQPWGWVIGNAVYMDDLDALFWSSARKSLAVAAGGMLLMIISASSIIWSVTRPIGRLRQAMGLIAEEDFAAEVSDVSRGDEIGDMARSLVALRDSVKARVQLRLGEAEAQRAAIDHERAEASRLQAVHANHLARVVSELGAGLARLAECNIRMTIDAPFPADFEPLRQDFNHSIATFQATLEQVLAQTKTIQSNSVEMWQAADNLAKRTEQQAAALEQTSAALEQVSVTVQQSSEKTRDTRRLVADAKASATASGQVVTEAVEGMGRIERASSEIGQIIGVIDQIAFQTNLLALNAGVEAARAGDAGKGFAVVAQEVRELAQKSADAARQIKDLISNSTLEVEAGIRLVGEAGAALQSIQSYVNAIDQNIDAIVISSAEQASGLKQISTALNGIDQMTQENAAMVEETTQVSAALAEGANLLSALVDRFKLNRRAVPRQTGVSCQDDVTGHSLRRAS